MTELQQAEANAVTKGWAWLHKDPVLSYEAIRIGYGTYGFSYIWAGQQASGDITREQAERHIARWRDWPKYITSFDCINEFHGTCPYSAVVGDWRCKCDCHKS